MKINLTDLTFLIPVRIDSPERAENLSFIIEFIKNNFIANIFILEADDTEKFRHDLIDKKIFVVDKDPVFYRTRYINTLISNTTTEHVAVWDADVIVDPVQVKYANQFLREHRAAMAFPYDGRFIEVHPIIRSVYRKTQSVTVLLENVGKMNLVYGNIFVGGAFLVNKKIYTESGMENENFYGWGPEDMERVKRMEILEHNIARAKGPMFHFAHPRLENSWFASYELEVKNREELLKICSMDKEELIKEIDSWNHGDRHNRISV